MNTRSSYYHVDIGRYNLCSNEKDACLKLYTSGGNFSALFEVEEAPNVDGLLPSEVLDLIEGRLDSYWISTSRKETKERILEWRKEQHEFDAAWLAKRIEATENELKELKYRLQDIKDTQQEATGAAS